MGAMEHDLIVIRSLRDDNARLVEENIRLREWLLQLLKLDRELIGSEGLQVLLENRSTNLLE